MMTGYEIALAAALIVLSIFLIIVVLLQESKSAGLSGAIAGGADSFYEKNKGRSKEAKLAFFTKIFAVVFMVTTLVAIILFAFIK